MDSTLNSMARHLVASLDYDEALRISHRDPYRDGISHLSLLNARRMTLKAIIMRAGTYRPDALGYLLPPHDHPADTETAVIAGEVADVTMAEEPSGRGWYRSSMWQGQLGGGGAIVATARPCQLVEVCRQTYGVGGRWASDHRRVHTMAADGRTVVLLVVTYHEVKSRGQAHVYHQEGERAPVRRDIPYPIGDFHQDVNLLRGILSH